MSARRAWESHAKDRPRVQCIQLHGGNTWLHASAYVEIGADWVRVDMRGRTRTEYPQSVAEWREYCADAVAVFAPEAVTA